MGQPLALQEQVGDQAEQRVPVQADPGAALEVVEAEFLFKLLVRLLAHPARLDRRGQPLQGGAGRQIGQVTLALAQSAALSDQPSLLAGHMLGATSMQAHRHSIRHAHAPGREGGLERTLGALPPCQRPPAFSRQRRWAAQASTAGTSGWREGLRAGGGATIATSAGNTFWMRGMPTAQVRPRAESA